MKDLKVAVEAMGTPPNITWGLLADMLECNHLTQAEAAHRLGVGRQTLTHILHDKRPLSLDMAHRLGRLFGNGPAIWLKLQQACQMWDLLHEDASPYERIVPLADVA